MNTDKNKYVHPQTDNSTEIELFFKSNTIITSRPEGMKFEEYKKLRNEQSKLIKSLLPKKPFNVELYNAMKEKTKVGNMFKHFVR